MAKKSKTVNSKKNKVKVTKVKAVKKLKSVKTKTIKKTKPVKAKTTQRYDVPIIIKCRVCGRDFELGKKEAKLFNLGTKKNRVRLRCKQCTEYAKIKSELIVEAYRNFAKKQLIPCCVGITPSW